MFLNEFYQRLSKKNPGLAFVVSVCLIFFVSVGLSQAENELKLTSDVLEVCIDANTGSLSEIIVSNRKLVVVEDVTDRYEIETESTVISSDEKNDRLTDNLFANGDNRIRINCRNLNLPGLQVEKVYRLDESGTTVIKIITLSNQSKNGYFVKHFTEAKAGAEFRKKAFYFQPQKGNPNAIVSADKVNKFIQVGSDQAERQRMMLIAPGFKVGVVHYKYKIDNRYCLPRVGNNFSLYGGWTPKGWRFSTAAFYLKPGDSRSVEYRIEINDGDILGYFMRYRDLDELKESLFKYSVPQWVQDLDVFIDGMGVMLPGKASSEIQDVMGKTEDWWSFLRQEKLNLGMRSGMFRPHWGDIPVKGTYKVHNKGGSVSEFNLDGIYKTVRRLKKEIPGIRLGQYNMFWFIDSNSQYYKDRPDALIYRKDGQPDYEGSEGRPRPGEVGHAPSYLREFGAPGIIDLAAQTAADHLENMEYDYLYIDGTTTGISRLNWKRKQVTQPYVWIGAYNEIREGIRQAKPDAVILQNADTLPMAEMNYWEYYGWRRNNYDWRHIAVSLPFAKIMVHRDSVIMLHKWNNDWASKLMEGRSRLSDKQYAGYLLGFGLLPMYDNLTLAMAKQRLPIVRAAKELRGSSMVDANVNPAWWHHVDPTGVEAYTLRKGTFGLIPVMSRQEKSKQEEISFDTKPLGLIKGQRMYLWMNSYQPPTGDPMKSDEPYERVFTVKSLLAEKNCSDRVSLSILLPGAGKDLKNNTEPGPLQLMVASPVPVWCYSADGIRYQSALPEQKGLSVYITPSKTNQLQFRVSSDKKIAQVFLPLTLLQNQMNGIQLDYQDVKSTKSMWDSEQGILVDIPYGSYILTLK